MNSTPKRILHITEMLSAAGIESFIMNVYRNIDRSKIQTITTDYVPIALRIRNFLFKKKHFNLIIVIYVSDFFSFLLL